MNIYVGNLSYSIKDADLAAKFGEFGAVKSAKVIKDRDTNRSKGFGFVEFENDGDGKEAIEQLAGTDFNGRPLVVKEALPKN